MPLKIDAAAGVDGRKKTYRGIKAAVTSHDGKSIRRMFGPARTSTSSEAVRLADSGRGDDSHRLRHAVGASGIHLLPLIGLHIAQAGSSCQEASDTRQLALPPAPVPDDSTPS